MSEEAAEVFDGSPELENFIFTEDKMSLVHTVGYVTRNDEAVSEKVLLGHTNSYFTKQGQFTKSLDRGELKVPSDQACQWTFFCFSLFHAVMCVGICVFSELVSEFYNFDMKESHCIILSNIFLNNLCRKMTPRSGKKPAMKVLKLS